MHLFLTKLLCGLLVLSFSMACIFLSRKIFKLLFRVFSRNLRYDDAITLLYLAVIFVSAYYIGDYIY